MRFSSPFSRRSLHLAAVASLLLGTTACTSVGVTEPYTPGVGTETQAGDAKLRGLVIVETEQGKGRLTGAVVSLSDDTLTGVKGTATDHNFADLGALTLSQFTVTTPADKLVKLDAQKVTVSGDDLKAGLYARLVFTFTKAGDVSVLVPVVAKDHPDYQK